MNKKKLEETPEKVEEVGMEENTKSKNDLTKDKKKLEQKRDRLLEVDLEGLIRFDIVKKTDKEGRVYYETVKEIDGKIRTLRELQDGVLKFQVHSCDTNTKEARYVELAPNQKFYIEKELPKLNREISRLEKEIKELSKYENF